jgi:hypothetical protein
MISNQAIVMFERFSDTTKQKKLVIDHNNLSMEKQENSGNCDEAIGICEYD